MGGEEGCRRGPLNVGGGDGGGGRGWGKGGCKTVSAWNL